jgi:arsenate reductase
MFALGLQGSPRKKGNSDQLLRLFMDALRQRGAATEMVDVCRRHIEPCRELTVCEKKGFCPIDDDMDREIYPLLRRADLIVVAAPVFFYNVPAQLKALIDRCQTLWARKYILKLKDPGHEVRRGFFLGVGATRGKQLFDGLQLTAKYFFDAVAAQYTGSLTFRGVEGRGDILKQEGLEAQIAHEAARLTENLVERRKVLFVSRENACRSQMAAAFARLHFGDRLDAACAGSAPAPQVDPRMVEAMQALGIDMAFQRPMDLERVLPQQAPDDIITMGDDQPVPAVGGARQLVWDLPDPAGQPMDVLYQVRDRIQAQVKEFVMQLEH